METVADFLSLQKLQFQKLIGGNLDDCTAFMLATYPGQEGEAVVIISRKSLNEGDLPSFFSEETLLSLEMSNDVFCYFSAIANQSLSRYKVNIIFPASQKQIQKYSFQKRALIAETAKLYHDATLPFISKLPIAHKQWVYNILEGKKEVERVLFSDTNAEDGFVLLPDSKWDLQKNEQLYCQAIVQRRDILTVRDLNASHLPLLTKIRDTSFDVLRERFGVLPEHLRVYVHYWPTFFHFHVHFVHVETKINQNSAILIQKAIPLNDIIQNITLFPNYYAQATLEIATGELDPLYNAVKAVLEQ